MGVLATVSDNRILCYVEKLCAWLYPRANRETEADPQFSFFFFFFFFFCKPDSARNLIKIRSPFTPPSVSVNFITPNTCSASNPEVRPRLDQITESDSVDTLGFQSSRNYSPLFQGGRAKFQPGFDASNIRLRLSTLSWSYVRRYICIVYTYTCV